MLYELRHHDLYSTRSLETVNRQMEAALPIWKRLGIEPVGFWSAFVGPVSPRLTSLLAWENLEQRERLWDAFLDDPEWQQIQAERFEDSVRQFTNTILRPLPDSPLARHDNQPGRLAGGVFELRTASLNEESKLRQASQWFTEFGQGHMQKHGMFLVGVWETVIGVSPRLTYMLVFENLAHRERAWASFYTDPVWPLLQENLFPDGRSLIAQTESSLMRGSSFSSWR